MPVCHQKNCLVPLRPDHLEETPEFVLREKVDHPLFAPSDVLSGVCPNNGR